MSTRPSRKDRPKDRAITIKGGHIIVYRRTKRVSNDATEVEALPVRQAVRRAAGGRRGIVVAVHAVIGRLAGQLRQDAAAAPDRVTRVLGDAACPRRDLIPSPDGRAQSDDRPEQVPRKTQAPQ